MSTARGTSDVRRERTGQVLGDGGAASHPPEADTAASTRPEQGAGSRAGDSAHGDAEEVALDTVGDIWEAYSGLLDTVERCIRYHWSVASLNVRIHRLIGFVSVALGTSAVGALLARAGDLGIYLAAAATLLQSIDLFVDFARRGDRQAQIRRGFQDLKISLLRDPPTRERIIDWQVQVEALNREDDLEVSRVLNAIARNEVARVRGVPREHWYRIGPVQRWFATHLGVDLMPWSLRTWREHEREAAGRNRPTE